MKQFRQERSSVFGSIAVAGRRSALLALLLKFAKTFNVWLWLFVFLPSLAAAIYYFGMASDLYMSEARFIVRSQGQSQSSILGSLLESAGLRRSTEDASAVESFLTSRDAVRELDGKVDLRAIYDRPGADLLSRFPNAISGSSFEALYKHYLYFTTVESDAETGVTTLEAKAYRPEDAQAVVQALLQASERLVNQLNERAEADALSLARREVDKAEQNLGAAEERITSYRFREQILDPKLTSTAAYTTLGEITKNRIETEVELAQLTKDSPGNPAIPALRTRLSALDVQLASTTRQITGNTGSIAAKLGEYEQLLLDKELAEKMMAAATQSLETARLEAERKHLYVEHIAAPSLPDYALYPKRILSFSMVLVSCILIYGVAWLLIAGIREHAQA